MLKTKQIRQFCNVKKNIYFQKNMIFQKKGRPQGNGDKTDLRLFSKKTLFFKKSRPQGNEDKTDLRLFLKHPD